MSWQRIFESARKRGLPLVVTDIAGREPLVVMTLEEYERLEEGKKPEATPLRQGFVGQGSQKLEVRVEKPIVDKMEKSRVQSETLKVETPITLQSIVEKEEESVKIPQESAESAASEVDGLSLEERFYFEPVDGENGRVG